MHLRVLTFDGTEEHIPLTHSTYARRYRTNTHHYTSFTYDCPCGSQHETVFSWNGWNSAGKKTKNYLQFPNEAAYRKAVSALQPFAPKTTEFQDLYGSRNTSETMHSQLDMTLPFKRLQRWGIPAKTAALAGYLMGHIAVFNAMHDDEYMRSLGLRT